MPNYNIYVSIILMIYYLLFSVGGTLILYTCTYFYHYCAWRFSFTEVTGFCIHEFCDLGRDGQLSNIFDQNWPEGLDDQCPGLHENLKNIQKGSRTALAILEAAGIYEIIFGIFFILAITVFQKRTAKNLKLIRWSFHLGTWLSFGLVSIGLILFYCIAGFAEFKPVLKSGTYGKDGDQVNIYRLGTAGGIIIFCLGPMALLQASVVNSISICRNFKLQ